MKKICMKQAEEEKPAMENKWSAVKAKPIVVCQKELKQLTEVPNIFSRSSMYQETVNQITPSFKKANV